ncbi:MAG: hypothetical protein RL033_3412, partial [Pseudomonadota bacterium]
GPHVFRIAIQSVGSGICVASTSPDVVPPTASDVSESAFDVQGGPVWTSSILVVDDDPATLRLVEAAVGEHRSRLTCLLAAQSALVAAEDEPPGVVVLDLLMPGMDGFQFLARFRELPGCAQVPVVIWTAKDVTSEERASLVRSSSAIVPKGARGLEALLDELQPFLSSMG